MCAKALGQKRSPWMSTVAGAEGTEGNGDMSGLSSNHTPSVDCPFYAYTTFLGLALAAVPGNGSIFRQDSPLLWD